jgi:hypothetical protein
MNRTSIPAFTLFALLAGAALAAPDHKPRMGGGGCPAPEGTVNAGTKSEFCSASADHKCAAGRVLKRKGSLELCVNAPAAKPGGRVKGAPDSFSKDPEPPKQSKPRIGG